MEKTREETTETVPTPRDGASAMKGPAYSRKFEVDFYEQDDGLWRITSHLRDGVHDIEVGLVVSVPDMVVRDADLRFLQYPLGECLAVVPKIKELVGACLFDDYSTRSRQLFAGPGGCPNVMNLLSTSGPALIYFYFPGQVARGAMKPEEWWGMCATRLVDGCIAHRLMAEKYAGKSAGHPERTHSETAPHQDT